MDQSFKTARDRKQRSGGDASSAPARLEQEPAFANSELAKMLLDEAARQQGIDTASLDFFGRGALAGLEEDPEKFWFAEDGDDDGGGGKARRQQDLDLPALRPKHEDKEYEDFEKGTAFVQGEGDAHEVDANDVKQGALGDCYLIAGMAGVARANPEAIKDLIKDNGDGTFDVTLHIRSSRYSRPRPVVTTIDAQLAVKSSGRPLYAGIGDEADGEQELWTALIEKAVAQQKDSYDLISGGNINGDGFVFAGTSELLTGKRENYYRTDDLDEEEALLYVDLALDEKLPVTCDSRNLKDDEEATRDANRQNVYWNHAYAPQSVDLDGYTFDLQNPWGSSHVDNLSAKDFLRFYRSIRIGGGGI
jgi:hypothetical protein